MFRKIGDALRRFMAGRYGTDKLNQWLLGLAIVLIVLGLIGSRTGSSGALQTRIGSLLLGPRPRLT